MILVASCREEPVTCIPDISCSNSVACGIEGKLQWTLCADSVLYISGAGKMSDYWVAPDESADRLAGWYEHKDSIFSIIIGNDVTSIGDYAFLNFENLTSVTIGNSVTVIGNRAFMASGLTSVTIPESVTEIGKGAFGGCIDLRSVSIPNSVTKIGEGAFYNCRYITSIDIPNLVTKIAPYTFYDCGRLTSVVIPDLVTEIGEGAFTDCRNMTSVTIGSSLKTIDNWAFTDCIDLTEFINYSATPQVISDRVFLGVHPAKCTLFVPAGSETAYRNAEGWEYFENIQAIE